MCRCYSNIFAHFLLTFDELPKISFNRFVLISIFVDIIRDLISFMIFVYIEICYTNNCMMNMFAFNGSQIDIE